MNVLHIGAVGEAYADTEYRVKQATSSVHADLTEVANQCVGVDTDERSVKLLAERHVFDNILVADATALRRESIPLVNIDVIIAGDTIEHLTNPGSLLECLGRLADPDTKLLLTTPNAASLGTFVRNLRGRPLEGPDHVCSFNLDTLSNLIQRYGWVIREVWTCYQANAQTENPRSFGAGKALLERIPRLGGTLLVVCEMSTPTL